MDLWCVCIYLGGFTYAHQVRIYIETGVHCYTSASCRQLKGYWVSEDSLSLSRSHVFPIYSQLLSGKCTEALPGDSCCYSILEGLCFPITKHRSDTIWQVLVCRNLNSWHPTQWWEGSGLDQKKLNTLYCYCTPANTGT